MLYRYLTELELKSQGFELSDYREEYDFGCFDVWWKEWFLPRMIPVGRYGMELSEKELDLQNGDYSDCVEI